MYIRIETNELEEFNSNLKKIKTSVEELNILMERVKGKVLIEKIITDPSVISEIEELASDINNLKDELGNYIYDINLIKDEFKAIDQKLKEESVELKNMIQDLLRKTKNSFIPATYSINASISSDESQAAMKVFGVDEKVNQTIELGKYNEA